MDIVVKGIGTFHSQMILIIDVHLEELKAWG
jgi:hypothetical protein